MRERAENLEDRAEEPRVETPVAPYNAILTGHYHWTWTSTWRSHGTADWLLIYTVEGAGRFGHRSGEIIAEPGDAILIRPGTLHDYDKLPEVRMWEILWAHFQPRPEWREWLAWPEVGPGLTGLHFEGKNRLWIKDELLEAHHAATGSRRRREAVAMNGLERVLLRCDELNPAAGAAHDVRIRAVMDHLCRHLREPLSREGLAELSGLSVSRLSHLFREQVGLSMQQFLEGQRLDRAKQLLEFSPLTIGAISEEVGYDDPFYFSLRFKQHTGKCPRLYRQEQRGLAVR